MFSWMDVRFPTAPPPPTYHKGYTITTPKTTLCGVHFERLGTWRADWETYFPPVNTNTHTKYIADKMRFFNIDVYAHPHTLRTGVRVNTKHRIPYIYQLNTSTFAIYGMGSRGYINAPYTAYLMATYVLHNTHHPHLERMVP